MALAKFYEDNYERLLEDWDTVFPPAALDLTPPPAPEQRSGWLELRHSGRLVSDREVFIAGRALTFIIGWQEGAEKPCGTLHPFPAGSETVIAVDKAGHFELKLALTGLYELKLRCGLHERRFRLEAVASSGFASVARIQEELNALCAATEMWTREQLEAMRQRLLPREQPPEVPRDFCDGLMEYHLALLLEKECRPEAGGHFECAYTRLRPYTKYSLQAEFIATYFLYRINNFDSLEKLPPRHSRFLAMCAFFHRPYDAKPSAQPLEEVEGVARFPMIIAGADEALLAAVDHLSSGNLVAAREQLERAYHAQSKVTRDGAAERRLHFVAARLHRRAGDTKQACFHYAQLDVPTDSVFSREATEFVEEHRKR